MMARLESYLWVAQRLTAALLIVGAVIHMATNVYAVRGGLSAAEVVDRIHGNQVWLVFYLAFATTAAIHGPLGLRTILLEMTPIKACRINVAMGGFAVIVLWLGWRAVLGLYNFGGA